MKVPQSAFDQVYDNWKQAQSRVEELEDGIHAVWVDVASYLEGDKGGPPLTQAERGPMEYVEGRLRALLDEGDDR